MKRKQFEALTKLCWASDFQCVIYAILRQIFMCENLWFESLSHNYLSFCDVLWRWRLLTQSV